MGAPLRRSARLLKSESSVPVARDLDVEMVNSGGGPVEQQRPDTRPSVSHSSVSQDPTTAPSPKPELGESTDDDDEEPANHHVRTNRPDRRQVPRSTTPASQPTKPVERDATSPQRPSVPRLLSEPSRKRKTSDRPMDTGSDTDYEDYQGLSPPGQDESESDSGTESRQQTRKSTRPRRGKKIHDTLQDGSDGLIHPRPVLKRPRRKRRKNISMTTDYANETLHTTPLDHGHEHEHEHGHTSDHCHDHGHPSEHTHEYGTHHGGVLPASGPHRHHHHQHGHDDSPRIHNHHEQRPYWKEHQLMDSVSISELRTRLLGNGWENSKTDPSVMIARQPAMCIKFGLKPEEKTEDASQTDRDTVQYELDYDGTLVLSSPDQKAVNDVLGILWVYLRHNNDDDSGYDDADEDADYEDADYEDADYDDDDYDDADYELPVHPFTSRQDTSQHPPDLSSRKRKVKDFVSLDSDDESAQHAVRVKLPYRNRDLPPNRQETPQHDTEMEDPVTDSHQDDNESGRTHVNALDGLQSTKQNPNKAVDVSIDGFVETTFLLRVGSSRTELEATLQDFKWRKHHFDESHYVYKHRADIHLFDDRFYLSGNKTEYFNLWHRNLQKFIHEEQDSVDKSTIAAAVPQWRKRGEQSTLTPYVKMTFARLLEECRERNPEIPTKPKDSRSTRRHATGPELIDRLMADDDAHHQQEESKNAVALVQSMHKNEALDDLQFECNRCGETKPRSDFTRANRPSKELEQRKACNECAEKEAAQRLAKKEHALKERTQFMRNKYPDELGIGELSTRDLTQCMLCRHFYLKGFDREEHRKTCPLLNKMCKFCSRGFPNEVWQADHCSEARCEEVRARQKHQREEAKGYCPYCYLTFPLSHAQYSFHVTACHKEHTLCTPCGKYFKAGQIDNHECKPLGGRWTCKKCWRGFKIEHAPLHQQEGCEERFKCGNCSKFWDTKEERRQHDCIGDSICPRCAKTGFRKGERALHVESCTMKQCGRCRKFGFPKDDLKVHYDNCPWRFCQTCQRSFESVEALRDHICHKHLCKHCGKMIPEDDHVCEVRKCKKCNECVPKADYYAHKVQCAAELEAEQDELRKQGCCSYLISHSSKSCPDTPVKDLGLCMKHASMRLAVHHNTAIEKLQLQQSLFTDGVLLAALPELRRLTCAAAVTKYMSILRDCPERVLEADIEGNVGASIKTPFHTFQVTISNGKGEVVVPQTVIDHGEITKEQLLHLSKANSHVRVRGSFEKYYEEPSQERATGRVGVRSSTWSEIAVQLEVYRVKRGLPKQDPFLAFVDWSVNHVDFDAIKAGLASVKPEHLAADMIKAQLGPLEKRTPVNTTAMIEAGLRLTEEGLPSFKPEQLLPADPVRGPEGAPVDFNPLLWWRVFKRTMGLTKGSRDGYLLLGLSNFFSILYPDERRLAACAHDSGPDVEMLFKILRFTRIWWQECRIDGRLGRHLTKNGVVGPNIDDDALRKIEEEEYEAIVKEGETEREEADADNSRENVDGKYVDRDDTGALVDE